MKTFLDYITLKKTKINMYLSYIYTFTEIILAYWVFILKNWSLHVFMKLNIVVKIAVYNF